MFREFVRVTRTAINGFLAHNAPRLGAALSFYSVFSLAPLLVVVLAIVSLVLDADRSRDYLMNQLVDAWGPNVANSVAQMVDNVMHRGKSGLSALIAFGGTLLGATAVFAELKRALDDVFGVNPDKASGPAWYSLLAVRVRTISLILALALLLLASLAFSASLSAVIEHASDYLPPWFQVVWIADQLLALAGAGLLYFFVMRFFPDRPPSKDAAIRGALVSAMLFSIGRHLIGIYIGVAGTASAFGAAGTLAVLLVWMYYTWQILVFGAEVARALDDREVIPMGSVQPAPGSQTAAPAPAARAPVVEPPVA